MQIITIYEENHGLVGVAESKLAAIQYLVFTERITENSYFWDKESYNTEILLKDLMTQENEPNMIDFLLAQNDEFWDASFSFQTDTLIKENEYL